MVTQVGMSLLRPRMRAPRLIFTAGYLPLTQNESISCNVVLRGKPAFSQQTLRIHPVLGCSANPQFWGAVQIDVSLKAGLLAGPLTDGHIMSRTGPPGRTAPTVFARARF